jgi:hypothetical protein
MTTANVVFGDFSPFSTDFVSYVDSFNPVDGIPAERVRMAGTRIIPPLLGALEEQGLRTVVGHDLRSAAYLFRSSGGRMKRLIQTNDPRYHPNATSADSVIIALMRGGVPQGCVASRLLWCERTLAEEMENGQFWVSHPDSMWTQSDRCIVNAISAKAIRACHVVFSGSIYLAQGATGGNTLAAMLRLHHLWVLCHWRWSWLVGIIEGALARRHVFDVYGAMGLEMGIWRTRPGEGDDLHRYEMTTCEREACMEQWLRPEIGQLSRPLGRPAVHLLPSERTRVDTDA